MTRLYEEYRGDDGKLVASVQEFDDVVRVGKRWKRVATYDVMDWRTAYRVGGYRTVTEARQHAERLVRC